MLLKQLVEMVGEEELDIKSLNAWLNLLVKSGGYKEGLQLVQALRAQQPLNLTRPSAAPTSQPDARPPAPLVAHDAEQETGWAGQGQAWTMEQAQPPQQSDGLATSPALMDLPHLRDPSRDASPIARSDRPGAAPTGGSDAAPMSGLPKPTAESAWGGERLAVGEASVARQRDVGSAPLLEGPGGELVERGEGLAASGEVAAEEGAGVVTATGMERGREVETGGRPPGARSRLPVERQAARRPARPDLVMYNTLLHGAGEEASAGHISGLQHAMNILHMLRSDGCLPAPFLSFEGTSSV